MVRRADIGGPTAAITGSVGTDALPSLGFTSFSPFEAYARLLTLLDLLASPSGPNVTRAVNFDASELNSQFMTYYGIEQTRITGSVKFSDLIVYENGASYDAGENANGVEGDTFLADFSRQQVGINFTIHDLDANGALSPDVDGQLLENGVFVRGMDRAVIRAGQGSDVLLGGRRDDYFSGGGGPDQLWGRGGDDVLDGGAGADIVYWFSDGNDTALGGAGDDVLFVGGGSGGMGVRAFYSAGDSGLLTATSPTRAIVSLLSAMDVYTNVVRWLNQSGSVFIDHTDFESVNVVGQDGANDLVVYQGGVAYTGGASAGDADIFAGNFTGVTNALSFDVGLLDSVGAPVVYDIGNGVSIGQFERLVLELGTGDDRVVGGALDDVVYGGGGNDDLNGGAGGNDELYGGDGADLLTLSASSGTNAVLDGGPGVDIGTVDAVIAGISGGLTVTLFNSAGVTLRGVISAAAVANRASLTDLYSNTDLGNLGSVTYRVAGSSFTLAGLEVVNITSGDGADVLISGSLGGHLMSGAGADVLLSQSGNDLMLGGDGIDTYVFNTNLGNDVIAAETVGGAVLMFINHRLADLSFAAVGNDLRVNAIGGSVTVAGYFNGGGNGLNFSFSTSDFSGTRNLSALGAPGGVASTAGVVFNGRVGDDEIPSPSVGADTIFGRNGTDFIHAGPGADIIDGGGGRDTVTYAAATGGVSVDLRTGRGLGDLAEGDILLNVEDLIGGQGPSLLQGDLRDNVLTGGNAADTLRGGDGQDVLLGNDGNDQLAGEGGDDQLTGDAGDDQLDGGAGFDVLGGGTGDDRLDGGADDDVMSGGAGNDMLLGGTGNDMMIYGGDDDTTTAAREDGIDSFDGGDGRDTAAFSLFAAAVMADLRLVDNTVTTGDSAGLMVGPLRTIAHLSNVEGVLGSEYADVLIGNSSDNVLHGNGGDDRLSGGGGADALLGGDGSDTADYSAAAGETGPVHGIRADIAGVTPTVIDSFGLTDTLDSIENFIGSAYADRFLLDAADNAVAAGDGADTLAGADGNDTLAGEGGNDSIEGGLGDDVLLGNSGADLLSGGDGNDALSGGDDADTLSGGVGNDVLVAGNGNDMVDGGAGADVIDGGAGADTIDGGSGSDDWVQYLSATAAIRIDLANHTGFDGVQSDSLANIEHVLGSNFADVLIGDEGSNRLTGGDSNDTLRGAAGGDTLDGGAGSDLIDGGAGDDYVSFASATTGVDLDLALRRATSADGVDTLVSIEHASGSAFADSLAGDGSNNLLNGQAGNDTLRGVAGDDVLYGGAGDDVLDGGAGNDIAFYEGLSSSYVITSTPGGFTIANASDGTDTLVGMELAQFSDRVVTLVNTFVVDTTAPTVVAFSPANNGQGVPLDAEIVVTFSEVIRLGSGTITLLRGGSSGSLEAVFDNSNLSVFGNTLHIKASSVFSAATTYGIAFSANAVQDFSGNAYAGGTSYAFQAEGRHFTGGSGTDRQTGTAVGDTLDGGAGDDTLDGAGGDDVLRGGQGIDKLDGGAGIDTVGYEQAPSAVSVNLALGTARGGNGNSSDVLLNFEAVIGSGFNDTLAGSVVANTLRGGAGNDTLTGDGGDDLLDGGAGSDVAVFSGAKANYTITRIESGVRVSGGADGVDTLLDIEFLKFSDQVVLVNDDTDWSPPVLLNQDPLDGATGVNTAANIVLGFSETVLLGTGSILLKTAAGVVVESFDAATSQRLALAGSTLTIDPTANLAFDTAYRVELPAGSLKDAAGNVYAGLAGYDFRSGLQLNSAPVGSAGVASLAEDLVLNGTLPKASDANGDPITYARASNPGHGSVTVSASGSFSYTPAANFNGSDSFGYTISDGQGGSNSYMMALAVSAVNDAPLLANALPDQATTEAAAFAYTVAADAFSDVDNPALSLSATLASGAALPAWLAFSAGTRTFSGTAPRGTAGEIGVVVSASDGQAQARDSFTLTVARAVNQAPVSANGSASPTEDTAFDGLLPGASDGNGDALYYGKGGNAAHGSVSVSDNGSFHYVANANFNGSDAFTFKVSDAFGGSNSYTMSLQVGAVDDAPLLGIALPDRAATVGQAFGYSVPVNTFSDVDNPTLTYSAALDSGAALPAWLAFNPATRAFSGTPPSAGSIDVKVTASDGQLAASDAFTLMVAQVANAAPVSANGNANVVEDTPFSGTLPAAADNNGDALYYGKNSNPTHGSVLINADGSFHYTPFANFSGADSFSFKVSDVFGASNTYTESLLVAAVNDAPRLDNAIPDRSATGGLPFSYTVAANAFSDVDSATLSYSATLDTGLALPAWLGLNPSTRAFSGTPPTNGSINLRVTASDGLLSASDTFTLTVLPGTNVLPVSSNGSAVATEDTVLNGTLPAASDANGDALYYGKGGGVSHGAVTVNANGSYAYTPAANYSGVDSFFFNVADQSGVSPTYVMTLTVLPVNDAPRLVNALADRAATAGQPFTYSVAANAFSDVDNATLTYSASLEFGVVLPAWLAFDPATRAFSGTPPASGTVTVFVTASDGQLAASDSFTVNVAPAANAAPVSANGSAQAVEDTLLAGTLPVASDPNGDALYYSKTSDALHGRLFVNANGSYTYLPGADYNGGDSFGFKVSDPSGTSNSYQMSLTVAAVNDAPTGVVTISGAARVGQTLSVSHSLADADGLGALGFQWLRDGTTINAASASSYTVAAQDVGSAISVRVSYTDGGGTTESVASAATALVVANDFNPITGTSGNDRLLGGAGADSISGLAGDDVLLGGGGSDVLDGGLGFDVASYGPNDSSSTAINASLLTGLVMQGGDTDTLLGIEALFGSKSADVIRGADTNSADGNDGMDTLTNVERLIFNDKLLAFGTRAEEIARVAFVLWTPGIVTSSLLFARGYSFYDVGYGFAEMCGAALQFHDEQGLAFAQKLKANMPGSSLTVDQIFATMTNAGGGQAGRVAAVIEMTNDAVTAAAIEASGIRNSGVVADLVVPGFGALFGLLPG